MPGHLVEPKAGWARILNRAGIDDLRIHDLRRTLGSWMADTDANLHVIGKTLGHQSSAATQIYARLSLNPVREAKRKAIDAMTGKTLTRTIRVSGGRLWRVLEKART